jgi:hypothetical protein
MNQLERLIVIGAVAIVGGGGVMLLYTGYQQNAQTAAKEKQERLSQERMDAAKQFVKNHNAMIEMNERIRNSSPPPGSLNQTCQGANPGNPECDRFKVIVPIDPTPAEKGFSAHRY